MECCSGVAPKPRFVAPLVRKGYIKGIIGLPANLFYGTGIPACIVVIDKKDAQARKGIFIVDASQGFIKDGPKNRLRSQDIHKIVDAFTKLADLPGYSRMVAFDEIEGHGFNLNLPRYIDSQKVEDRQDIEGHVRAVSRNPTLMRSKPTGQSALALSPRSSATCALATSNSPSTRRP